MDCSLPRSMPRSAGIHTPAWTLKDLPRNGSLELSAPHVALDVNVPVGEAALPQRIPNAFVLL